MPTLRFVSKIDPGYPRDDGGMFWMRGIVSDIAALASDAADFGILAQAAVARLPQIFRAHLVDVVFPI